MKVTLLSYTPEPENRGGCCPYIIHRIVLMYCWKI